MGAALGIAGDLLGIYELIWPGLALVALGLAFALSTT
jgi:hypothetical protein